MDGNMKGRVAVVTGAGSGIGSAVALALARKGVGALALVDRTEAVRQLATSINDFTENCVHAHGFVGDVTRCDVPPRRVRSDRVGARGAADLRAGRRYRSRHAGGQDRQGDRQGGALSDRSIPPRRRGESFRLRLTGP